MSEKLYLYPQSSCNCYSNPTLKLETGNVSNMPYTNCKVPKYFQVYNRIPLEKMKEQDVSGSVDLNSKVFTDKYSKSFHQTQTPISGKSEKVINGFKTCSINQYKSRDPRLYDEGHATWTTLNSPPLDSTVRLKDVYNTNLKDYGQKYKDYSDINAGQILYYIDREIAEPYFNPLFSNPSEYTKVLYKDPMDTVKPEYPRNVPYKNPMTVPCPEMDGMCLSSISDSNRFREDLLTTQMAKMNQSKYTARWN